MEYEIKYNQLKAEYDANAHAIETYHAMLATDTSDTDTEEVYSSTRHSLSQSNNINMNTITEEDEDQFNAHSLTNTLSKNSNMQDALMQINLTDIVNADDIDIDQNEKDLDVSK